MDSFIDKYYKIIKQDFLKFEENYQKKKHCYIGVIIFLIVIILVDIYLITKNTFDILFLITILIALFFLLLAMSFYFFKKLLNIKEDIYYAINTSIYKDILMYLGNNDVIFEHNTQLAIDDFNKMNIFNLNILNYVGSNFTASSYHNYRFILCDVVLYDLKERIKTDEYYSEEENINYIINYHYHEQVNIFKGIYLETTIKKDNNQYIYLIPDNISDKFVRKNIYRYLKYQGKRIELENIEFEKKYQVYAFNEIKSRVVLSLSMMDKINEIDKLLPYKKYYSFKEDGRVGIYIDKYTIDKLLKRKIKKLDIDYVKNMYQEIEKILKLVSIMNEDIR